MKLLYIANLRLPTEKAYGIQIAKMCEAFALEGLDVTLIYPFRGSDIKQDFFSYYSTRKNFKIKMLQAPDFYFPGKLDKAAFNIKNFISALLLCFYALTHKANVIYSRDEWPIYLLSFFKKNLFFEAHKFSDSRKFFYRKFLGRNVKLITISESLKNKFLKFGFSTNNILVAHDGVDLGEFNIELSKEDARSRLSLSLDEKIVMYTGHLFDWKGADTLALAAKLIPGARFIFVGGMEHDINKFKNKFGDISNISILGNKPHNGIPVFLKAADVLVLPNSAKDKMYLDTSPLKLFEYMASGRPIIASGLSSIKEILNEKNSVLVKPDDIDGLAGGIKKILENNIFGEELAKKAKQDSENYTWSNRAKKIIGFMC